MVEECFFRREYFSDLMRITNVVGRNMKNAICIEDTRNDGDE